jgi:hypothetical protein
MSSANRNILTSSLSYLYILYIYFSLVAWAKNSNTILNNNGGSGHPSKALIIFRFRLFTYFSAISSALISLNSVIEYLRTSGEVRLPCFSYFLSFYVVTCFSVWMDISPTSN